MKTPSLSPTHSEARLARRGFIVMLLSVVGFTVNTLLLKYLGSFREIPSLLPMLFRASVGMIIVLAFFRGRRPTRIRPVFTEPLLYLRGLTGLLGTAAYYWTVPTLGAGKATLFCNTYVLFAAIIAALCLGEKLTWARFSCLSIAFVGIILLSGPDPGQAKWTFGPNEIIALVGAVLAASSVVLVRQLTIDHSIGTIYLAQCVWIFFPILLLAGHHVPDLDASDWFLLIGAATAASYGQLAMNEGYRCLTVSTGASLQMLWPLMTSLGGLAWFDERFAPLQVVGAALLLGATWMISTRQ